MRTDILYKTIEKWGIPMQFIICMEELAELIQEISKQLRGNDVRDKILAEMADVYVCLEQLKVIFVFKEKDIQDKIEEKIKRIEERMQREE